jgi:hypothetical protein
MDTTRIMALVTRLRRRGVWEGAERVKNARIRELKSQGMPRQQARETAWVELETIDPPPSKQELELQGALEESLRALLRCQGKAMSDGMILAIRDELAAEAMAFFAMEGAGIAQGVDHPGKSSLSESPGAGARGAPIETADPSAPTTSLEPSAGVSNGSLSRPQPRKLTRRRGKGQTGGGK